VSATGPAMALIYKMGQ